VREIRGRQLCLSCYNVRHRNGTLCDYPRAFASREEWLEDYRMLAAQGFDRGQIAERFGVTRDAVDKRLMRYGLTGVDA
jgi:hypothetical protein